MFVRQSRYLISKVYMVFRLETTVFVLKMLWNVSEAVCDPSLTNSMYRWFEPTG